MVDAGDYNSAGENYIYMAIRRGGMQTPTTASDVFAIDTHGDTAPTPPAWNSGFPVDMAIYKNTTSSSGKFVLSGRLTGTKSLNTNSTDTEGNDNSILFDFQNGYYDATGSYSNFVSWMWARARGYFDVVTWAGTGSARTQSHNLGVVPEMMWVRPRNLAENWAIYHKDVGATKYLQLNSTAAAATSSTRWNDTTPTSSVFSLGADNEVNATNYNYIGFLFATVAGVSKVGSFTSDGSDMTIDCGFTSGASFVLLKRTDDTDDWFIFRDIVAGNDKRLKLNTTGTEATGSDNIDPDNSGFIINNNILGGSGRDFIFYAIAATS